MLYDLSCSNHVGRSRLDLTLITSPLRNAATREVYPTVTSDHFGLLITLTLNTIPPLPLPPSRLSIKKTDWAVCTSSLEDALTFIPASPDLDNFERQVVDAFQNIARASIPLAKLPDLFYKDHWIYGDRVRN